MPATADVHAIDGPLWNDAVAAAFETWVHAACLVPIEHWPLLRLARDRVRSSRKRPPEALLAEVRDLVGRAADGATITDIEGPEEKTAGWECSKPAIRRVYGYYVLAVLDGDQLTGRTDLRRTPDGALHSLAAIPEPGADPTRFNHALATARDRLQQQLGDRRR
jgi:uncharacterized protein YcaQ